MTSDFTCPLTCNVSQCPVFLEMRALLDEVKKILDEEKTLKIKELKTKKSFGVAHVNGLVVALQIEHPEKSWTSGEFAKKIGCSGAVVRSTRAWKDYQERQQMEAQSRLLQRRYKNESGDTENFGTDGEENF